MTFVQEALDLTPRERPSASRLLDVREVYAEPAALASPRAAGGPRWRAARVIEVPTHWQIPDLHGNAGNVDRWVRVKTGTLVLGEKKALTARPDGRSSDWIAPSTANGCAMACAYCYLPRRKGYANPITVFTNIDRVVGYLPRHVARQGAKAEPNQCDPLAWVYGIGENATALWTRWSATTSPNLVTAFRGLATAKASFATKFVNRDLLRLDPQGRTRSGSR